MLCWYSV